MNHPFGHILWLGLRQQLTAARSLSSMALSSMALLSMARSSKHKKRSSIFTASDKTQRGIVVPIFAIAVVSIFGIVALAVDLAREQIAGITIQATADAASLAASRQLDGTKGGWIRAKRAAAAAISQNMKLSEQLNFNEGKRDYFDISQFSRSAGSAGKLSFALDRGMVRRRATKPTVWEFVSLEQQRGFDGKLGEWKGSGVPVYLMANVARLRVRRNDFETTFGKVLGQAFLGDVERVATAYLHGSFQENVFPVAIPLCELALNTNPVEYYTDSDKRKVYNQDQQCEREVYAVEGNPYRSSARAGGLLRALSYPRPGIFRFTVDTPSTCLPDVIGDVTYDPFDHDGPNCMSEPMLGVLGVPSANKGLSQAQVMQGVEAAISGTPTALIGDIFLPVDELADSVSNASLGLLGSSSFETKLQSALSGNNTIPFSQAFYSGGMESTGFPYLRELSTEHYVDPMAIYSDQVEPLLNFMELFLSWPGGALMTRPQNRVFPLASTTSGDRQWVNPECHSPLVDTNPASARVRRAKVMVVNADNTNLCLHRNKYPISSTNERPEATDQGFFNLPTTNLPENIWVVGFTDAYFIDFNVASSAGAGAAPSNSWQEVLGDTIYDTTVFSAEKVGYQSLRRELGNLLRSVRDQYINWVHQGEACLECKYNRAEIEHPVGCNQFCLHPEGTLQVNVGWRGGLGLLNDNYLNANPGSSAPDYLCLNDPTKRGDADWVRQEGESAIGFLTADIIFGSLQETNWKSKLINPGVPSDASFSGDVMRTITRKFIDKVYEFYFCGVRNQTDVDTINKMLWELNPWYAPELVSWDEVRQRYFVGQMAKQPPQHSPGEALPAKSLLPALARNKQTGLPKDDCWDMSKSECWEVKDRAAGWGCGGLRMKLECATDGVTKVLPSPVAFEQMKPALVSNFPEALP